MRISVLIDKNQFSKLIHELKPLIDSGKTDDEIQLALRDNYLEKEIEKFTWQMRDVLENKKSYWFQAWLLRIAMIIFTLITSYLAIIYLQIPTSGMEGMIKFKTVLALLTVIGMLVLSFGPPIKRIWLMPLPLLYFHPLLSSFFSVIHAESMEFKIMTYLSGLCFVLGVGLFGWLSENFTEYHFRIKKEIEKLGL